MRLALISFEYPPAIAIGGIGTYALETAKMLVRAGMGVEIFSAGPEGTTICESSGAPIHRVAAGDRAEFKERIFPVFKARHTIGKFDLLESPEIGAEGDCVAEAFPEIARVVKLHTPSYLVGEATYEEPLFTEHIRYTLGALRRGRWATLPRPSYEPAKDQECLFARTADEVAAPGRSIGERLCRDWSLNADKISYFPLPFRPSADLLSLPIPKIARTVGFLGRLEARKGIVELVKAIPAILQKAPTTRFRLIGPSWPYKKGDMVEWIQRHFPAECAAIDFVGRIARDQLATELSRCDIIALPSRWESFGYVVAEALASGRAVIGSAAGGMADIIESGVNGLLVPPRAPSAIAGRILALIESPGELSRLAEAGRQRVLHYLSPDHILPLQIASYRRAMQRRDQRLGICLVSQ